MTESKTDGTRKVQHLVRPFIMGELWAGSGGMKCEAEGCTNRTFTVWLTKEENASLPESSGPRAAAYLCNKNVGVALCELCKSNSAITVKDTP